jgi:predicted GIY-YIG superfamily endonuclease
MIPRDKFDEAKHKEAMSIYTENLLGGAEQQSGTAPHRLGGEIANSGISVIPNLSDSLFYFDGTSVVGSHTAREIQELFQGGKLKEDTQICTANDHTWKLLKDFPHLMIKPEEVKRPFVEKPEPTPPDNTKKPPSGAIENDDDDEDDEEDERLTPIKSIRALLNDLWEAQRESIIARVKNEDLSERHEKKRKEHSEIKDSIEELVLEYWRRSKVLDDWIRDLIWESEDEKGDYTKKLKKGDSDANFATAIKWVEALGVDETAGCYAFREGKNNYIYIGKAEGLKRRLQQHEGMEFWARATHLRLLIPQHKASVLKLERLLLLKHDPERNKIAGHSTQGSRADQVLEMINAEINELLTDE